MAYNLTIAVKNIIINHEGGGGWGGRDMAVAKVRRRGTHCCCRGRGSNRHHIAGGMRQNGRQGFWATSNWEMVFGPEAALGAATAWPGGSGTWGGGPWGSSAHGLQSYGDDEENNIVRVIFMNSHMRVQVLLALCTLHVLGCTERKEEETKRSS